MIVCACYSFPSLGLKLVAGEHESSDKASTPTGEEQLPEYSKELDDVTKSETGEMDGAGGREVSGSEDIMINIPSPIPELDCVRQIFKGILSCYIRYCTNCLQIEAHAPSTYTVNEYWNT